MYLKFLPNCAQPIPNLINTQRSTLSPTHTQTHTYIYIYSERQRQDERVRESDDRVNGGLAIKCRHTTSKRLMCYCVQLRFIFHFDKSDGETEEVSKRAKWARLVAKQVCSLTLIQTERPLPFSELLLGHFAATLYQTPSPTSCHSFFDGNTPEIFKVTAYFGVQQFPFFSSLHLLLL